MRISNFKNFVKINEEGWKENILVGLLSLLGTSTMGQNVSKNKIHTKSEVRSQNLIKQGWSLDSTQVDTLFTQVKKDNPEAEITVSHLNFDKNSYFASGKFELSQVVRDSILNTMTEIATNEYVITDIVITSSTDKQGLSRNLQLLLKNNGFSPDNKGLSLARSRSVSDYLKELGVNDTLISQEEKYEQGEFEIDQSARYVNVDIYSIKNSTYQQPPKTKTLTKTYFLSKEKKPPVNPPTKISRKNKKTIKLGPIKNFKSREDITKCWK